MHIIGPGGERQEVTIGDTDALRWAVLGDPSALVLDVQTYAVGGLRVLVALRPGTTPLDLALALLRPEVSDTGEVIP